MSRELVIFLLLFFHFFNLNFLGLWLWGGVMDLNTIHVDNFTGKIILFQVHNIKNKNILVFLNSIFLFGIRSHIYTSKILLPFFLLLINN